MRQGYSLLTSEMFDTYEIYDGWLPTPRPNLLESLGRLQTRMAACRRGGLSNCSVFQPAFVSRPGSYRFRLGLHILVYQARQIAITGGMGTVAKKGEDFLSNY